jgi:hypothetical protein
MYTLTRKVALDKLRNKPTRLKAVTKDRAPT